MRGQQLRTGMGLIDMLCAAVLLLPLLLLALTGNWWGLSPLRPVLKLLWMPLLLAAIVQFGLGLPIYVRALAKLVRLHIDVDTLLAIGATSAFALACWNYRHLVPVAGADQLLMIWRDASFGASLIAVARLGEIAQRNGREPVSLPLAAAPHGQIVIAPGDFIPRDGVVRDGVSEIQDPAGADDIFPIMVAAGTRVHAGARNGDGSLTVETIGEADTLYRRTTAQLRPDRLRNLVNWVARGMLLLATAIMVWRLWRHGADGDAVAGILRLFAIMTPLGLGLVMAAPASEVLTAARRLGIEIRDLAVLDGLRRVAAVVLGHRGVLVPDRLRVISVQCIEGVAGSNLIRRVAAVAQLGHDPWGKAVLDFAVGYRMRLKTAEKYRASLGQGISAWVEREETLFGTRDYLEARGVNCAELDAAATLALSQGRRLRWVGEMSPTPRVIGFIIFGAPSVAGAAEAVRNLDRLGLETAWLAQPGDAAHVALAKHLKIGRIMSDQPAEIITGLEALRRKIGPLLLVTGDVVPEGLAADDIVLPFGRRIMEQLPGSALATIRHDPRIIVDLIRLAVLHRRLVLTNAAIAFAAAGVITYLSLFGNPRTDLGSFEVAIVLFLAMSSLGLRAMPTTANEVDEE